MRLDPQVVPFVTLLLILVGSAVFIWSKLNLEPDVYEGFVYPELPAGSDIWPQAFVHTNGGKLKKRKRKTRKPKLRYPR
jgi:hypothetical protein